MHLARGPYKSIASRILVLFFTSLVHCPAEPWPEGPWTNWVYLPTGTEQTLHDLSCVTSDDVWIVGEFDAIFHTVDRGLSWTSRSTGLGTRYSWWGVSFADSGTGWVVGEFGTIMYTASGGLHWVEQTYVHESNHEHDFTLHAVQALGNEMAWIVGDGGTILHTSNAGGSWEVQQSEVDNHLYSVLFVDSSQGWTSGSGGLLLRTVDGGNVWSQHTLPAAASGEPPHVLALHFVAGARPNSTRGWVAGRDAALFQTTDGGDTWTAQTACTDGDINDIILGSDGVGWTASADGSICVTSDSGAHWVVEQPVTSSQFYALDASSTSPNYPVAVGDYGRVFFHSSPPPPPPPPPSPPLPPHLAPPVPASPPPLPLLRLHPPTTTPSASASSAATLHLRLLRHPPPTAPPATSSISSSTSSTSILEIQCFDGVDDFLLMPVIANKYGQPILRGVSVWVYVEPQQRTMWHSLMDARFGEWDDDILNTTVAYGGDFSNRRVGELWQTLYVDGTVSELTWSSIPIGQWVHVHAETVHVFKDDMNFMSATTTNSYYNVNYTHSQDMFIPQGSGCLTGRLASVYFWDRLLSQDDFTNILQGFNEVLQAGLVAVYKLEEGSGYEVAESAERFPKAHLYNQPLWVEDAPAAAGWTYLRTLIESPPPPPPPPSPTSSTSTTLSTPLPHHPASSTSTATSSTSSTSPTQPPPPPRNTILLVTVDPSIVPPPAEDDDETMLDWIISNPVVTTAAAILLLFLLSSLATSLIAALAAAVYHAALTISVVTLPFTAPSLYRMVEQGKKSSVSSIPLSTGSEV
ncbi:hypothetical protein CYMTET_6625 [Cymbomonas tetramitiformis]|uniref:Photosynthesis system II assembly factor Ycf48/Hcf136-like domain-containing protein n=1 Tax=Cymbomonas tetramitiformis TaxID=36881 RepID=A0AAE0LI81_9CHLO|nr:hypothetical protein CYMTET_6625 [Cymbomonas tetramitiformis]